MKADLLKYLTSDDDDLIVVNNSWLMRNVFVPFYPLITLRSTKITDDFLNIINSENHSILSIRDLLAQVDLNQMTHLYKNYKNVHVVYIPIGSTKEPFKLLEYTDTDYAYTFEFITTHYFFIKRGAYNEIFEK